MILRQGSFHKCEQYVQIKGYKLSELSRGTARLLPMETITIYVPTSAYFPYQKVRPMKRQKVQRSSNSSEVTSIHLLSQH